MKIRHMTLLLLSIVAPAACFLLPKEEQKLAPPLMEPPQITYETIAAKRGTIFDDFRVSGMLAYSSQENLSFRSRGGRLLKLYVGTGDRVKSGQLLAELDTDALRYEISIQEIEVQKARLVSQRAALLNQDKIQQQMDGLDVRKAELTLESLKSQLTKAQLVSPIGGIVVYLADFGEGDEIDAYQTLMRVADPSNLVLSYNGDRASSLAFGMNVEVSYRERTFSGTVIQTPTTAPNDLSEAAKNRIIIRVKGLPANAEAGELATIRVVLQRRDNVIVIPRNLVQMYSGADYVDVLDNKVKRQQPVERGITTTTEVEIVKGLNEGDEVIVR